MAVVGRISENSNVDYFSLQEPLARIDFLYTRYGLCNVKFVNEDAEDVYWTTDADGNLVVDRGWVEGDALDDPEAPYGVWHYDCVEGADGVGVMSIAIDDVFPLVGLRGHATSKRNGLESLGFIWWNRSKDECL